MCKVLTYASYRPDHVSYRPLADPVGGVPKRNDRIRSTSGQISAGRLEFGGQA